MALTTTTTPAAAAARTAASGAGIQLQGLVKTFSTPNGPVRAVRGVDIAITPGETVALLGPNGAGKSTTIDMLLGLAAAGPGAASRSSAARRRRRSRAVASARCSRPARSCAS